MFKFLIHYLYLKIFIRPVRCIFSRFTKSCCTTPYPSCILITGSCILFPDGHTFHGSNGYVLDTCWHSHQVRLANLLCVAHHILLGRDNLSVHCGTHGLHNLYMHSEALQHITSALPASFLSFAINVWSTVAGCFAPCCPHDWLVLQWLS